MLPELRLAQIPPTAQPAYTGDRISYMEAGEPDAFPVMLLHGIGANSSHWRFQFEELANNYRVIAWNAPGYYLSDNLMMETPTPEDYANTLKYLADWLGTDRFHLVGNSFGSQIAGCFVSFYPEYVQSLAMTGTSRGRGFLSPAEKDQVRADRLEQISAGGFRFGSQRWRALLGLDPDPDSVKLVQEVLRITNRDGFLQAVRFGLELDTLPLASNWEKPMLIIQGSADQVTPYGSNGAKLAELVANCRTELLDGIGHLPELEAADTVNQLLLEFFEANE